MVVGIFLGELIAPVGIVGQVFILLLQMTVLPYVLVSLVAGLGGLTAREAAELARRGISRVALPTPRFRPVADRSDLLQDVR